MVIPTVGIRTVLYRSYAAERSANLVQETNIIQAICPFPISIGQKGGDLTYESNTL